MSFKDEVSFSSQTPSRVKAPGAGRKSVVIGLLHSLHGTMALSEGPLLDAERMAIDEINGDGGILGCVIEPLIADGASTPERFAQAARELLAAGASALFGCWTSASRKAVRPVVEGADSLLWYPVQYEGLEESACICYTGSCLNQQIIPAVNWILERIGNRLFLLGSDYIFPRAANQLIRTLVASRGGKIVDEQYAALGEQSFGGIIEKILQTQPCAVINTLNGDSNLSFYRQYCDAGILPARIPAIATSVTETEFESIADAAAGHYACWSYFQSLNLDENRDFIRRFKKRHGQNRLVSAPLISAYNQLYLWKQAAENAGTFDPPSVRRCLAGCALRSPMGSVRIETNRHLSQPVRIGRLGANGQFEIVWDNGEPVPPLPWLGMETMEFAGKAMVRQCLASFADNIDYAWTLEHEISERKTLETALLKAHADLEGQVEERTRQLEETIEALNKEAAERRLAEEAKGRLEAQNHQLQKSESLGRMAGAIAHHFNNQLQVVMMNLTFAAGSLAAGEIPSLNLDDAMQAARKAAAVSSSMLTYLGQTACKQEPIDLSEACRQLLVMLQATIPANIILQTNFCSPGPMVRANAGQINQVITNLTVNACEAAKDSQGVVRLSVATAPASGIPMENRFPIGYEPAADRYACIEIADSGCGIPPDNIGKIFDPFFSDKFTGRGLGLPVALGIVKAHRGVITVESQVGKGSIFRIFLPLQQA